MTREDQIAEAITRYQYIENFKVSPAYALLIPPLEEELEKLKSAYDCKSLLEMATLKGKREGLRFVIDIMERAVLEGERSREEALEIERKARLDNLPIDSTDL